MSEISPISELQNITIKQKTDMTKVAIKNKNITSFGGIYRATQIVSSQKELETYCCINSNRSLISIKLYATSYFTRLDEQE